VTNRRRPPVRAGAAVEAALVLSVPEAAEALGLSARTFAERVLPALSLLRTSEGTLLVPQAELEAWRRRRPGWYAQDAGARPRGRPPALGADVLERIVRERAEGRGLTEIARRLERDGVPAAQGGTRWWPSSVRWALGRAAAGEVAGASARQDEQASGQEAPAPAEPSPSEPTAPQRRPRRRRRRTGTSTAGGDSAS